MGTAIKLSIKKFLTLLFLKQPLRGSFLYCILQSIISSTSVITPLKHITITLVLLAITGCSATILPDPEDDEMYSRPDSSSSSSRTPSSSTSPSSSKRTAYTKPYQIKGKYYYPLADARGFEQQGIASWYGEQFHGRKTANGETYNMYDVSAAHKTLPLGTWVRVYNLENRKTLDVRINDRGPFVIGRIIDLSYKAAQMLGVAKPGTAQVKIVALGEASGSDNSGRVVYKPVDYFRGNFTVQVGAFTVRNNAQKLKIKLGRKYINSHINEYTDARGKFYRVRVGRFKILDDAERFNEELARAGAKNSFVVAE